MLFERSVYTIMHYNCTNITLFDLDVHCTIDRMFSILIRVSIAFHNIIIMVIVIRIVIFIIIICTIIMKYE